MGTGIPSGFLYRAVVTLVLGVGTLLLVHVLDGRQRQRQQMEMLHHGAERLAERIESELQARELQLLALGRFMALSQPDATAFAEYASALQVADPDLEAVLATDADLVVTWVYPTATDESLIGRSLAADPLAAIFRESEARQMVTYTEPVETVYGVDCVIMSAPVGESGQLVQGYLRVHRMLLRVLAHEAPGIQYTVRGGDSQLLAGQLGARGPGYVRTLTLGGREWQIEARSTVARHSYGAWSPLGIWLGGLTVVGLLILGFYQSARREESLDRLVAARTEHLERARQELLQAVSERELAESRKMQVMARYDYLVQTVPAGVWRIDAANRTAFVNVQMAAMLGLTPADMIGRPIWDFMTTAARTAAEQSVARRKAGSSEAHDFTLQHADGSAVYTIMTTHPLDSPDGSYTGTEAMVFNITERVRAEAALRESEARFRGICETSPAGIFLATPEGDVVYRNPALSELAAERGGPWLLPLTVTDRDRVLAQWRSAIADARPLELTARFVTGAEERWCVCRMAPVRDGERLLGHVGMVQDITQTVRTTEELTLHRDNLERLVAMRTADLEAYAYSVSHDMREPLRNIQAYVNAIEEDNAATLAEPSRFHLQRIRYGAERLDRMAVELFNFQRVSHMQITPKPVDLGPVLHDILESRRPELDRLQAEITVEAMPSVSGTRAVLEQIFGNLIGNALKFHAPGKAPVIRIWAESLDARRRRIWVEDRGIGIPVEAGARIFKLFERLHGQESYDGIGVGLAVVQRAAQRLGGDVGVVSAPGQGSRFWVILPDASAAPPTATAPESDAAAGDASGTGIWPTYD